MANRVEKVNSLISHQLADIIHREVLFPANMLVTLTKVQTSANLIETKAFISVYPEEKMDEALAMLKKDIFHLQQELNEKLNMRPVPKIIFVKDEISGKAERVEELLHKLKSQEK